MLDPSMHSPINSFFVDAFPLSYGIPVRSVVKIDFENILNLVKIA